MDRYKFEDSISAYIDNELNLTDRQEFEDYIQLNPDAKSLLDDIINNMDLIKGLPKVKTSSSFMPKLLDRIEFEKNKPSTKVINKPSNTVLGFTPLYASIMSVLIISFITVGYTLWSENMNNPNQLPNFNGNISGTPSIDSPTKNINNNQTFVSTTSDSADTTNNKRTKVNLDGKVNFVKKQR